MLGILLSKLLRARKGLELSEKGAGLGAGSAAWRSRGTVTLFQAGSALAEAPLAPPPPCARAGQGEADSAGGGHAARDPLHPAQLLPAHRAQRAHHGVQDGRVPRWAEACSRVG